MQAIQLHFSIDGEDLTVNHVVLPSILKENGFGYTSIGELLRQIGQDFIDGSVESCDEQ